MADNDLTLEIKVDDQGSTHVENFRKTVEADMKAATEATGKAEQGFGGLWKSFSIGVIAANAFSSAIHGAKDFLVDSVKLYSESEQRVALLANALQSNAGAAGQNIEGLKGLAEQLAHTTLATKGQVISAETLLLSFRRISGDAFPQVIKTATDVAARLGVDVPRATEILARAMEKPENAGRTLRQMNILLSQSEIDHIKSLVDQGKQYEASKEILEKVTKTYKGAGEAAADTVAGGFNQFQKAIDEMKKKVGASITENKNFKDALKEVTDAFNNPEFIKGIANIVSLLAKFVGNIIAATSTIAGLIAQQKELAGVQDRQASVQQVQNDRFITWQNELTKAGIPMAELQQALNDQGGASMSSAEKLNKLLASIKSGDPYYKEFASAVAIARKNIDDQNKSTGEMEKLLAKTGETTKSIIPPIQQHIESEKERALRIKELYEALKLENKAFEEQLKLMPAGIEFSKKLSTEQTREAEVQKMLKESFDALLKPTEDLAGGLNWILGDASKLNGVLVENEKINYDVGYSVKESVKTYETLHDKLEMINQAYQSFLGLLGDLGIKTDGVVADFGKMASGVATFATALATHDIAGMIAGATQAVGGLIKALGELFGSTGAQEAIARTFASIGGISDALAEKMHKLADEVGDAVKASFILMDEAIQAGNVTKSNFDEWTRDVHNILTMVDEYKMSATEAGKEVGDAFQALMDKAKDLGITYTRETISLLRDLRERGIQSKEVNDFVNQGLADGAKALRDYAAASAEMLSNTDFKKLQDSLKLNLDPSHKAEYDEINAKIQEQIKLQQQHDAALISSKAYAQDFYDAFSKQGKSMLEIYDLMGETMPEAERKFVEANKQTLGQVAALDKVMIALGSTGYLTDKSFKQFGLDTQSMYDSLIKGGATSEQALQAIMPLLIEQAKLANAYGYQIDETTKKWLEQQGIDWTKIKDPQQTMSDTMSKMLEVLQQIATFFSVDIPGATDKAAEAARKYGDIIKNIPPLPVGDGGDNNPGPHGVPSYANGGDFIAYRPQIIRVGDRSDGAPERVTVSRAGDDRGGKSVVVNLNVMLPPGMGADVNKQVLAQQIQMIVRDNIGGLIPYLKGAVGTNG